MFGACSTEQTNGQMNRQQARCTTSWHIRTNT